MEQNLRMKRKPGICLALLVICHGGSVLSNGDLFPNEENCGYVEEIPGDVRTLQPWTVAIYMRKNLRSPPKYFLTGSLITSTTVLTVFGGGYGQPSYQNRARKYRVPPPSQFLIAGGINSTDLKEADEFTQFANVSHVLPFKSNWSGNEEFHFATFRLATPMNLTTPYVKTVCIPFVLKKLARSLGYKGGFKDIYVFRQSFEPTFVSGFNAPVNAQAPFAATFLKAVTSNDPTCYNSYKYYYKSEPEDTFCLRISRAEIVDNSTCLTHGSMYVWKPTEYTRSFIPLLGPDVPRFQGYGPIGLIPRKERGQCSVSTNYFIANVFTATEWIRTNMICNSTTFPCARGKCIALDQACDGKQDCPAGEDEDPIYCTATFRCKSPNSYQCGLEGKCINEEQVGDGVLDCPSGSDEDPKLVQGKRFVKVVKSDRSRQSCFPLLPTEGVVLSCNHPQLGEVSCLQAPIDTEITFSCKNHYKPLGFFKVLTVKCYDDRSWKQFKSFSCQPGDEVRSYVVQGTEVISGSSFPWHAAILKRNKEGNNEYICGASLIERNVLITAAHCIADESGKPYNADVFKIVLNSLANTTNLSEYIGSKSAQVFQVQEIWRPPSYEPETFQSDIAVMQITKPVT